MHKSSGSSEVTELALSTGTLLDALSAPVVLVNSDCEIVLSNSAVDAFLARRRWLWTVDRRLKCRDGALMEFESLVRQISNSHSESRKFSVVLRGPKDDKVLISGSLVSGEQRLIACTLADPVSKPTADARLLRNVFGLTQSESLVAAMMAEGADYGEIAEARNISVETVRGYTRKIFKKMKVSSRAGVVSTAQVITGPTCVFSDIPSSKERVPADVC